MNNNMEIFLINFILSEKELPSKIIEQIVVNIRHKIEELILIVMNKSTHEERLFQTLQTNNKQFEIANIFLTG